jgi:transmembrane sensor
MSSTNESCFPDDIVRQSLEWIIRLTSGQVSTADTEAFLAWRSQSAVHATAFRQSLELRRKLQVAAREFVSAPTAAVVRPDFRRTFGVNRRAVLGGAMAASAAGLVVTSMQTGLLPSLAELTADYRTATGQQRSVAFRQGLAFELNTQTSLSVRGRDAVEIVTGEVAFEADVPSTTQFTVMALGGRVRASDASFNVRNTDDTVCITCVRGRVAVDWERQTAVLGAGQQVRYTDHEWSAPHHADVEIATAWRSGVLVFHDTDLTHVLHEVNRYRPGKILITNDRLRLRRFSGVVQIKRPEAVMAQLRGLGAHVTSLPGGLVLVS